MLAGTGQRTSILVESFHKNLQKPLLPAPITERSHPRCGESSGGPCLAACHQWEPRRTPSKRVSEAQETGRSLTTQPPDRSDETRAQGPLPAAHTPRCCYMHPRALALMLHHPQISLVTLGGIPGLSLHICPQRASGHLVCGVAVFFQVPLRLQGTGQGGDSTRRGSVQLGSLGTCP